MERYFNVTGCCFADRHYMADIRPRLGEIKRLVDRNEYFVINRGRQYGKTTTLMGLQNFLAEDYIVFLFSFQGAAEMAFESGTEFVKMFFGLLNNHMSADETLPIPKEIRNECRRLAEAENNTMLELSRFISAMCKAAGKPVVLMIDEVDGAGNHEVFFKFLGMIRQMYLDRGRFPTFQSVILAGVYDIKNLKLKIRKEDERQYRSPWNIAADFNVDMSLSAAHIAAMLNDYEKDHRTGMDVDEMAGLIREYTAGYPFLVSRICKNIDEKIPGGENFPDHSAAWTKAGFFEAVRILVNEPNLLFDDMTKKLAEYPELYTMLHDILFLNKKYSFNYNTFAINLGFMFGFLRRDDKRNAVAVANRIFEMHLNLFFLSEAEFKNSVRFMEGSYSRFTRGGCLDMDLVMEKFAAYYAEIYRDEDQAFLEKNGCKIFLMHLKQIINGVGNYYREAQTFDGTRMDIVVDYLGRQHVVELKVWRGGSYHEDGESQLAGYLDRLGLDKGYMLIFNFNKNKAPGTRTADLDGKAIIETTV